MSLTTNQKDRLKQLERYMREVRDVEREDFDLWFKGKQEVATNVLAWIILIRDDQ